LTEGDIVEVLNGHTAGGEEGRFYRYRGYADFLSTDSGGTDDPETDDVTEDDYSLHLVQGSLVAEVDADGNKTGRIFELVSSAYDEDNPLEIDHTQSIREILLNDSFDDDTRFELYEIGRASCRERVWVSVVSG